MCENCGGNEMILKNDDLIVCPECYGSGQSKEYHKYDYSILNKKVTK